ncbi:MAG: ABC transporter substrate-binding protein [Actinomycetales bacterium]|jgi:polar amino acid transport system substrate-binding protein|nr:ABC transporter substrate-binding protein [Actinomycetales bacterium]HMT32775.1 ABC transporter substrate-binding protein [Dermatophilaceae bacterium]
MARRSILALISGVAVAGLALSACGSNSLSSGTASSAAAGASSAASAAVSKATAVDPALVAKLPDKIKTAGKIVVGTDATYAPNEFLDTDGKTVVGMDVDIFNAIAAKFGVKVEYVPATFDSIILGVSSSKYDIGLSSFTINDDRKKQVNMVSYFNAGTQWVTQKGNPKKVDPDNACGLNIGVQKGTVQVDDITARSKKCTDAGKPAITQIVDGDQGKVTTAVIGGKADAMAADSPVGLYAVKQTGGQLEALGQIYDAAPYGIVVPKDQTAFAGAVADALKAISTDGTYKAALTKWGNESGAITSFAVNP